jgi:predicted GH43/DUF377 family glycosyl hydrolase
VSLHVEESEAELRSDPARVVLRLFLPGEDMHEEGLRIDEIVDRILSLPPDETAKAARDIVSYFDSGTYRLTDVLREHAATVGLMLDHPEDLTDDQSLVLGASVTSEYAVEGAALTNPSAVPHPDQSGLEPGEFRVAVALRGIGEGHISSIGFACAVIGPGPAWRFEPRLLPLVSPTITETPWARSHLLRALHHDGQRNELTQVVANALPERVGAEELEHVIRTIPHEWVHHYKARRDLETVRRMLASAYEARFPADSKLSQRVLLPVVPEEDNGMEDARFVLKTYPDGTKGYEATYTAYDGRRVAPRLIVSPDLVSFEVHRMTGSAARNKGVALFPRQVGEEWLALTRPDGERMYIARSDDGRAWGDERPLNPPRRLWQIVQIGNCGSPIETDRGWLVLTHGVGPMRRYSIGAILLDLEEPDRVVGRLEQPFLEPDGDRRVGYVPNVVYSCGGLVHEGRLWLPYGVGDFRVRVASVGIDELLDAMVPVDHGVEEE